MLWIVGIGAGNPETMSCMAIESLRKAEVIVGYHKYTEKVKRLTNAEIISYRMGQELERCKKAIELSLAGKRVALISSGDPGIFGMASLALELYDRDDVEIIPSMPALSFAAARAGVPLGGDFSLISLSDLLVDWNRIVYLLDRAAVSDTSIVLINPGSKNRRDRLALAANTIARYRPVDTPVAIVENAFRENEKITIISLEKLEKTTFTNMNAIVFVGTTRTRVKGNRLITDRGYFRKGVISYHVELSSTKDPASIETSSLKFIKAHLKAHRFSPWQLEVVARMIHAVADFSIAAEVRFSKDFLEAVEKVIKREGTIWTDTDMARQGISTKLANRLKVKVKPLPKHDNTPPGTTRSAFALRSIKEKLSNALLVVGNAPTVLEEALELKKEGFSPSAIIGCPVGFVGTVRAKRRLIESNIPHMVLEGNRGGTPIAVAAVNALLRWFDDKG